MKQVGDNAKSDLNLGDKFKSVTETNGFLTKYCVTDEFKSCPKQIRNHFGIWIVDNLLPLTYPPLTRKNL